MERINDATEETRLQAKKFLEMNSEMLHYYPESEYKCRWCGQWKARTFIGEECPVLLRCAVDSLTVEKPKIETLQTCGVCGGRMVMIRGRYPRENDRLVCPTCAVERLEQVHQIASPDYGKALKSSPLIECAEL